MRHVITIAAAAVLVSSAPVSAGDGVLITHTTTSGRETMTHRALIEATRIRTEMTSNDGDRQTMVYDHAAGILRVMDDAAKTYSEITSSETDRVGGHMADAFRDLQRQAQKATPEERAQIEAMIKSLMGPELDYAKGGSDTVGAWACDTYVISLKGQKIADTCVAEPAAFGLARKDLEIIKPFEEFLSQVMKGGSQLLFNVGLTPPPGSSGIVVRIVAGPAKTELTTATRQKFADALFAVPVGYRKVPYPGLRPEK
ncbi:MAG TPA: hypothetical protein VKH42_10360 [Vicinamibacterales bacterium]|nr:hypothetical protein [Vicinamibacterales bacterium]